MINKIDISSLYSRSSPQRDKVDEILFSSACDLGFIKIYGIPNGVIANNFLKNLLRIFDLPEKNKRKLYRWNFEKSNSNVYRGWFPLQNGLATYKEGIDIGPDLIRNTKHDFSDPLTERSPLPPNRILPGWRDKAKLYYETMELTGMVLMRSFARSFKLQENYFDNFFVNGISTLRFLHYPIRDEESFSNRKEEFLIDGGYSLAKPHADSGFITLLSQYGVEGLEAQSKDGQWIKIIPEEEVLIVNFGLLLQKWTRKKIVATLHRVIGSGKERFSIPFFLEPSVDSHIKPIKNSKEYLFDPFLYGDFLWEVTTKFIEQNGIKHLRKPKSKNYET